MSVDLRGFGPSDVDAPAVRSRVRGPAFCRHRSQRRGTRGESPDRMTGRPGCRHGECLLRLMASGVRYDSATPGEGILMSYSLLVIGTVIAVVSCRTAWSSVRLRGTRVRGVIAAVDEQWRRGDDHHPKAYYHAVIEFETPRGIRFSSPSEASRHAGVRRSEIRLRLFTNRGVRMTRRWNPSWASGPARWRRPCWPVAVCIGEFSWYSSQRDPVTTASVPAASLPPGQDGEHAGCGTC